MSKSVQMSNDEILQYYQDALDYRAGKQKAKQSKSSRKEPEVLKRLRKRTRKVDSLPPTPQMSDSASRVGKKVVRGTVADVVKDVASGKPITMGGVVQSAIKSTKKAIQEEVVYSGGNTTGLSKPVMDGGGGSKPPKEDTTSEFSPEGDKSVKSSQRSIDVSRSFAPMRVTPAREIFMPLPPVQGGFKLSNGYSTTDFVPLVQRSNASYLGWSNRFNAVPSGSII